MGGAAAACDIHDAEGVAWPPKESLVRCGGGPSWRGAVQAETNSLSLHDTKMYYETFRHFDMVGGLY